MEPLRQSCIELHGEPVFPITRPLQLHANARVKPSGGPFGLKQDSQGNQFAFH